MRVNSMYGFPTEGLSSTKNYSSVRGSVFVGNSS